MRPKALAIGASVLALLVAGVRYWRPAPETADGAARTEGVAPTRPADDVSAITARAAESPDITPSVTAPDVGPTSAPLESPPSPLPGQTAPTPMVELLEAQQHTFPEGLLDNERAFAAESIDATWAPAAEARILDRIAQLSGLQLTGLQVECRSTMCRLQIALPGRSGGAAGAPDSPASLFNSLGLEPRWVIATVDASQTVQSVVYLWREGMQPARESAPPADAR
jgi:hypothetical protein